MTGRTRYNSQTPPPPLETHTSKRKIEPPPPPPPPPPPAEGTDSYQLEGLITTLATSFISLDAGEVDAAICRSLGILGEFAEVQRSYICLLSEDGTRLRHTHQWCVEGVPPLECGPQGLAAEDFPWLVERLRNLEDVHIPDPADLPPEAVGWRKFLAEKKVFSTLMVPLRYGPSLTGVLGFDSLHRPQFWTEELIALLKIAGVVFGSAIERKRAEEERSQLIAELQDSLAKVRTLQGLLPICASCKKIRDDKGSWNPIETYIRDRSRAEFTHGICPECAAKLYPQDYKPK